MSLRVVNGWWVQDFSRSLMKSFGGVFGTGLRKKSAHGGIGGGSAEAALGFAAVGLWICGGPRR